MPFNNPVMAGKDIVRAVMESPNYVHAVSGWAIFKDGSAEFHDIILPGGQGVSVFFASSAPVTTHVGDLWYNTSDGLQLSQWNGSAWVSYQIGTGAIASGAITQALIASGAVGLSQLAAAVTARSLGGITTTISGTAPGSPNTGDLWINSASGYQLNQWSGSAWAALSWNAGDVITAATITGSLIAASTIVGGNIAAGTITAANIQAATITAAQIAAATITGGNIAAATISGVNAGACFNGLNMIADPQFSDSALNAVRLSDPATTGTWTLSGGQASNAAGAGNVRLPLMPSSATAPSMWVNPGEQYYLSVNCTTGVARTLTISLTTSAGSENISASVNGSGTLSGTVTVPAGATWAYVNLFINAGTATTVTFSGPLCQPATLNAPSLNLFGADGELLVYSGTPATGNLIASVSGAAGTDDESNGYPAGLRINGTSGGSVTIDPTANSGIPYIQFIPKSAAHVNIPPQVFAGGVNLGASDEVEGLFAVSGQAQATANTNAALQLFSDAADSSASAYANFVIDGANASLTSIIAQTYLPVTEGGNPDGTASNTTTPTNISTIWHVPGDDANVNGTSGTAYRIKGFGYGLLEAETLNFRIVGYGGTVLVGVTIGTVAFPAGTAVDFDFEAVVRVNATGSSGKVAASISGNISVSSPTNIGGGSGAQGSFGFNRNTEGNLITVNTTATSLFAVQAWFGAVAAGQFVECTFDTFERLGN